MERIEADIYDRLSKVIDPELGRSITELGMIPAIEVTPAADGVYDVTVHVELTVEGCPLSDTITHRINAAVASYPDADLIPHIEVSTMDDDKTRRAREQTQGGTAAEPVHQAGQQDPHLRHRLRQGAASANRRSPPTWPPRSPRSAMTRPPSTPTSTDSPCRVCSACTRNRPTSTAC